LHVFSTPFFNEGAHAVTVVVGATAVLGAMLVAAAAAATVVVAMGAIDVDVSATEVGAATEVGGVAGAVVVV
jgi:hypothetical protein